VREPEENWDSRRRSAISVRRLSNSAALDAMGYSSGSGVPDFSKLDDVVFGTRYADGKVIRITAFSHYAEDPTLEQLVA
jgi:hypothetical protein